MGFTAANWNRIEDPLDKEVWDRLTANFWLPEKVPVANDLKSWSSMTEEERVATDRVFGGLTILDTLQSEVGAQVLHSDADSHLEKAVFTNIAFMESVHAKSYSTIFATLRSTQEIDEINRWVEENELVQRKIELINDYYQNARVGWSEELAKAVRKAASVILESFLFYSGFYLPLKFAASAKLSNTADIIRLILRDEGVHGFYIGAKFQQHRAKLTAQEKGWLDGLVKNLLSSLYENELEYTELIYAELGWVGGVQRFLRYNANKAMMNLGYDPVFDEEISRPEAVILASMAIDANENHDFFSGSGSSYVVGKAEATDDDDWD